MKRTKAPRSGARRTTHLPDRESPFGAFVRARRIDRGLTQVQLGEIADVGQRFVSELERNKPTLRLDALNRVLSVFGKRAGVIDDVRLDEPATSSKAAP